MLLATKNVPIGFKRGTRPMEHSRWGYYCGMCGGAGSFLLQIRHELLMEITSENFYALIAKIMVAGLTALICGFLGAMGKSLYDAFAKPFILHIKKQFNKHKTP